MAGLPPHGLQPVRSLGAGLPASRAAMIMIHGRNAGARNILDLAALFPHPDFTFLAPEAAEGTWYPFSFLSDTTRNEPGLSSGLSVIDDLVHQVEAAGIPASRIILLGFSQGACLSSEFTVRHAARYGGLVALSGGLIGPPGTAWSHPGDFSGTPVFLGCSDVDPHIPRERVDESAAVFRGMGAQVTERIYPGLGHQVNEDELAFVRELMNGVAGASP